MKVEIVIEEKISFTTSVFVRQPETMPDEEFETLLDALDNQMNSGRITSDEASQFLKSKFGIEIIEVISGYPDSPDSSEAEIIAVHDIREQRI